MAHANPLPENVSPVRCGSCKRAIGLAKQKNALRNAVYCDEWCLREAPATEKSDRNEMWEALVALGWSPVAVARRYEVPHSLVYKILARA